jgi:hypothetical protein
MAFSIGAYPLEVKGFPLELLSKADEVWAGRNFFSTPRSE